MKSENKPWIGGRVLMWKGAAGPFEQGQVVVLDKQGQLIWFYDQKAAVFSGVDVRMVQTISAGLPKQTIQQLIAETGLEAVMKTPACVMRVVDKMRPRVAPAAAAPLSFEHSTATG